MSGSPSAETLERAHRAHLAPSGVQVVGLRVGLVCYINLMTGDSVRAGEAATLAELLRRPRFEILPLHGIEEQVLEHVQIDIKVTVTASPRKGLEATLDLSERLARQGYPVVPHLAAQLIRDGAHLEEVLARLRAAGVRELYDTFHVAGSGIALAQMGDTNLNPWTEAKVNTKSPDRGPLLIIEGEKDHTVPWAMANAAYKRQQRNPAVTEIVKMPNRGHALTIDHGWREVAQTALDFVKRFA